MELQVIDGRKRLQCSVVAVLRLRTGSVTEMPRYVHLPKGIERAGYRKIVFFMEKYYDINVPDWDIECEFDDAMIDAFLTFNKTNKKRRVYVDFYHIGTDIKFKRIRHAKKTKDRRRD